LFHFADGSKDRNDGEECRNNTPERPADGQESLDDASESLLDGKEGFDDATDRLFECLDPLT
jgi:hypothetical protein